MDRETALRIIAARRRDEQMAAQQAVFARNQAIIAQALRQQEENKRRLAALTPEQRANFQARLNQGELRRRLVRPVVRTARNERNIQEAPQRSVLNMVGDCWGGVCRGASAIRNYTSRLLRGSQRNASPLAEAATMEAIGAAANADIAKKIAKLKAEIARTMATVDRTGAALSVSLQSPEIQSELDALLAALPPAQSLEDTPEFKALMGTSATGNSKNNNKTNGGKRTKRRKYNRK
jgi:hypothetical protein